jgi:hypothetical protein
LPRNQPIHQEFRCPLDLLQDFRKAVQVSKARRPADDQTTSQSVAALLINYQS